MLARLRKVLYWAACSLVIVIGVVIAAANMVREPADLQRGAAPRAPALDHSSP